MLSKILRGAVLATFAVGATVAQADPFGRNASGSMVRTATRFQRLLTTEHGSVRGLMYRG